ncbi:MAG: hypothetical protein FWC43_13875 [Planctomycetaceae bacterium]|nr:hypothetical protein [Planctomycetaceae bacterium]
MARLAWHPAFVQAIQQELEDYLDILTFESEHQLTAEPLKIDVLIIKKKNVVIRKNIAQIFRAFNVIEYKSPNDRATIEDYHKTQCYGRLYAALNKVDINEVSVTVVATRHPRKLLSFLKNQYTVQHTQPGIYSVEGDTCPTQVIVSEELPEEDNLWLNTLRNDLTTAQLERFAASKEPKLPIDAYIQVIGEANIKAMEELQMQRKKGVILSEKLDAFFTEKYGAPWIAEGEARGEAKGEVKKGREMLLKILRKRFNKVPKDVESIICKMSDPVALDSWAEHALDCQSMTDFAQAIR